MALDQNHYLHEALSNVQTHFLPTFRIEKLIVNLVHN